jgi:hypothetical protein
MLPRAQAINFACKEKYQALLVPRREDGFAAWSAAGAANHAMSHCSCRPPCPAHHSSAESPKICYGAESDDSGSHLVAQPQCPLRFQRQCVRSFRHHSPRKDWRYPYMLAKSGERDITLNAPSASYPSLRALHLKLTGLAQNLQVGPEV